MTTIQLPQKEGEFTPEEAQAWLDAMDNAPNLASDTEVGPKALKFTQNVVSEWSSRMRPLHRRWRLNYFMLTGNTLDRSGPEDVHVPELYKAIETIVPRIEEQILERDPWFKIIPRQKQWKEQARTTAAYIDWLFDQARVRDQIQPAARDMLITQCATLYVQWENRVETRRVREEMKEWTKDGRLKRSVKVMPKKQITYSGIKTTLVDPFDFIIDTRATGPQDALYVGHRVWMSVDQIRTIGKKFGWINIGDELDGLHGARSSPETQHYSWPRDPTAISGDELRNLNRGDGRPDTVELMILYSRFDPRGTGDYQDYQIVVSGGKLIHEVKLNQHDDGLRPYACMRVAKSGHSFYSIGPLDNAVRLNQQLDRYHQIFLRGAAVSAMPIVFAEEDSDMPDSLYKIRPFEVLKGTGPVRFTQVPDGFLRSAPLVLGTLQRNIEETVGAFRIQMGQDLQGGTATEATLSLQEGNRRNRAIIRGMATGLEQLLDITYQLARTNSTADVEFPVLGKRALDLKRDHATVNPADLLGDVKFDLVGLHSMRTYGLKATGLQAFSNSMAPFIMANPTAVNQPLLMHRFAEELIGPEEADEIVNVPTPLDQLRSQEEENEGLIHGAEIEIDDDDDHKDHMDKMEDLWARSKDPDSKMQWDVRRVVAQHYLQHMYAQQQKDARDKVRQDRMQQQQTALPPEAGGQVGATGSSPARGGMSDAMRQLGSSPGGQTPGETPGPPDSRKMPRSGGAGRPMDQSSNMGDSV